MGKKARLGSCSGPPPKPPPFARKSAKGEGGLQPFAEKGSMTDACAWASMATSPPREVAIIAPSVGPAVAKKFTRERHPLDCLERRPPGGLWTSPTQRNRYRPSISSSISSRLRRTADAREESDIPEEPGPGFSRLARRSWHRRAHEFGRSDRVTSGGEGWGSCDSRRSGARQPTADRLCQRHPTNAHAVLSRQRRRRDHHSRRYRAEASRDKERVVVAAESGGDSSRCRGGGSQGF